MLSLAPSFHGDPQHDRSQSVFTSVLWEDKWSSSQLSVPGTCMYPKRESLSHASTEAGGVLGTGWTLRGHSYWHLEAWLGQATTLSGRQLG